MANTYDIWDEVELEGVFVNAAGAAANPSGGVTCKVEKPSGTVVTPSVTNPSTGVFRSKVIPATGEDGDWFYSFKGTGDINQRHEGMFHVRPEQVPHP